MKENTTSDSFEQKVNSSDSTKVSEKNNPEITGSFDNKNNINTESFNKLQEDVKKLETDLKEAKKDFDKSRFDLITILGLFVGLITFLGLEVQVFKTINNPLMVIGITIFFVVSILLFVLCINIILKKLETITWKDFYNPLYIILFALLVISIFFIIIGYKDYSDQNNLGTSFFKIHEN